MDNHAYILKDHYMYHIHLEVEKMEIMYIH